MRVEISEAELKTRQSKGAVFICRSCKDNRNKIVMLQYIQDGSIQNGIHFQFCNDCLQLMGTCIPCNARKKLR